MFIRLHRNLDNISEFREEPSHYLLVEPFLGNIFNHDCGDRLVFIGTKKRKLGPTASSRGKCAPIASPSSSSTRPVGSPRGAEGIFGCFLNINQNIRIRWVIFYLVMNISPLSE